MQIPKAKDLEFVQLGSVPFHKCNMCGKPVKEGNALMASISLSDNASYDIIVCNEKCKLDFVNNPMADGYIVDGVNKALAIHGKKN